MEYDFKEGDRVITKCAIEGMIQGTRVYGKGYHDCIGTITIVGEDDMYGVKFNEQDNKGVLTYSGFKACKKQDLRLYKTMNKICETCDTRNRLHLCRGKTDNFKFCYRKAGSLENVIESITPFNDINELYNKINKNDVFDVKEGSLYIEDYAKHIGLLIGRFKYNNEEHPIGYVIK